MIVCFDSKVLRPPSVFALDPPFVLTSYELGLVQRIGEVILCKQSLVHLSCHEITSSNHEQVHFVIGAKDAHPVAKSHSPFEIPKLKKNWRSMGQCTP